MELIKLLENKTLDSLISFFFTENFKNILNAEKIYLIEIGANFHKIINYKGVTNVINGSGVEIIELEKLFFQKKYIYNYKKNIFPFIKSKNLSLIPIILNNTLSKVVIAVNSKIDEDSFRFVAELIEVLVEKINQQELFENISTYYKEIFYNINSLIILRDKNYNILFSNKELPDKYKCFDIAFDFNRRCEFCTDSNSKITQNINNRTFKIQHKSLSGKFLCIIEDITGIVKLQEELTKAEKLSFLGKISSEITHEIKNPLNSIQLKITLLKKLLSSQDNKINKVIESIESEILRLTNIVNDFLEFGKNIILSNSHFSLPALIKEIASNLEETLKKEQIKIIIINNENSEIKVYADRNKLKQAFLNLIKNSIEAFENATKDKKIYIILNKNDKFVTVDIKDNGKGIKDETTLFTPFYSTKTEGTGLGLIVTKKIIEAHSGELSYIKDKNWTIFRVMLKL